MNAKHQAYIEMRLRQMREVMALSKETRALETERTYVGWMRRFMEFVVTQADFQGATPEELTRRFVAAHARKWAVATVNQFRNAIVFYYRFVVGVPLGDLGPWAQALLGHADIATTQVYAHCLPRLTSRRGSPLDRVDSAAVPNVVPFPPVDQTRRHSA